MDYFKLVKSPLNYTGGKYKLLDQILPLFPDNIDTFVDLFCGGCNVGINVQANNIICIDNEKRLIRLFNSLKTNDEEKVFSSIYSIIDKYNLSDSSNHGYEYYNTNSSSGLGKYNKRGFIQLRNNYNLRNEDNFYYDMVFLTLIIYSFNNQIRFNSNGEYNIPVGKRDFNISVKENLSEFIKIIVIKDIQFYSADFREVNYEKLYNPFIYLDPPYQNTTATYSQGNKWNYNVEVQLLKFLDCLNDKKIKFALSNVLENNGKENKYLVKWGKKYNVHELKWEYTNSNYQKRYHKRLARTSEVLITNY